MDDSTQRKCSSQNPHNNSSLSLSLSYQYVSCLVIGQASSYSNIGVGSFCPTRVQRTHGSSFLPMRGKSSFTVFHVSLSSTVVHSFDKACLEKGYRIGLGGGFRKKGTLDQSRYCIVYSACFSTLLGALGARPISKADLGLINRAGQGINQLSTAVQYPILSVFLT